MREEPHRSSSTALQEENQRRSGLTCEESALEIVVEAVDLGLLLVALKRAVCVALDRPCHVDEIACLPDRWRGSESVRPGEAITAEGAEIVQSCAGRNPHCRRRQTIQHRRIA